MPEGGLFLWPPAPDDRISWLTVDYCHPVWDGCIGFAACRPTARNNSLENLALPRMRKSLLLLLEWFGPPRGAKRLPSWRSSVQGRERLSSPPRDPRRTAWPGMLIPLWGVAPAHLRFQRLLGAVVQASKAAFP